MSSNNIKSYGTKNKIESLQALRGIAFLGIASYHCGLSLLGPWSVTVFFMLSGFILTLTNSNKTLGCSFTGSIGFSIKKIRKLYPLYIFTLIAYTIYLKNDYSIKYILLKIFLLQSWVPNSNIYFSLNGVAWFFSDMLFIYCFFPIIKKLLEKYKNKYTAIGVIIGIIVSLSIVSGIFKSLDLKVPYSDDFYKWLLYVFPVTRLGDFIVGCNLGYIFLNSQNNFTKAKATCLETITVIMLFIIQIIFYINAKNNVSDLMPYFYLTNALLTIYLFTLNKGLLTNIGSNKFFIFTGNLSGYTFLLHPLVSDLLYTYFFKEEFGIPRLKNIIVFILSVAISLFLSFLYYTIQNKIKKSGMKRLFFN